MNKISLCKGKSIKIFGLLGLIYALFFAFSVETFAQKQKSRAKGAKVPAKSKVKKTSAKPSVSRNLPTVTQIDAAALTNLLRREGVAAKPLLVNFWATWCDPCREEFPELVKIDADYKGKIDFITVSLDDLAEINRDVPKFLAEMKSTMPAYLLKTENEETAIASVSKDWQGGLPYTILFGEKGEIAYSRQGKIKPEILRAELEKILTNAAAEKMPGAKINF